MNWCTAVILSLLVYCLVSLGFTGSLLPLAWMEPVANPALVAIVSSAILVSLFFRLGFPSSFLTSTKAPLFTLLWMLLSVISLGVYADLMRRSKLADFKPDMAIDHSFFRSIRSAPEEFQFFLHAAAVRDCIPYAWSYRQMDFYELDPNVAVNVLPKEWIERCKIERTQ
jgi:hypothetical protein